MPRHLTGAVSLALATALTGAALSVAPASATETPTPSPSTAAETPTPTPDTSPSPSAEPTTEPTTERSDPADPTTTGEPTPTPTPTPTAEPSVPAQPLPAGLPLLVTEIAPNGTGDDNFEFFEVTNTSSVDLDLAEHGVQLSYTFADSPDPDPRDKALTVAEPEVVVPAGESAVFWLQYTSGAVDSSAHTDDELRAAIGAAADVPVLHVTGQPGMANGGERGIRLSDAAGTTLTWSYYASGTVGEQQSAHFGVPAEGLRARAYAGPAPYTPGTVEPEQLTAPEPGETPSPTEPTTDPTAEPTTDPTGEPTADPTGEPTDPTPGEPGDLPVDPTLQAPVLQVTEVAPDTANVGGADAYEFIEVYNGSDQPVDFGDYTISYLYVDGSHLVTNAALWPAVPADPVIAPGGTLVLWIKNGANDALTAADFNSHFGSTLTAGTDLVEIHSGGMANGGLRGLQVQTNTGHVISRADYMSDAETVADKPIQYRWEQGTDQTLIGPAAATPGRVSADQVPPALVATPADDQAPVVTDLTGSDDAPEGDGTALLFDVSDDQLVRTVELTVDTDVDEPTSRFLQFDAPDRYGYVIPSVDLFGKRWVEYTVRVSDGRHEVVHGPVRITLQEEEPAPVRLDVTDGEFVSGVRRVTATAAGDPAGVALSVDGTAVTETAPTLEQAPRFAFEATNTDAFFRNGVKLGDTPEDIASRDALTIFDEGFYATTQTVSTPVPVEEVVQGQRLTVGIYAGTKAWPTPDENENNDDFTAFSPRLALPDGRVLRPTLCRTAGEGQDPAEVACPEPGARIGFNDAGLVYFLASFDLPDDAFTSRAYVWDTTAVADGEHTVTATLGDRTATSTVVVDNTAPAITTGDLADGDHLRGPITLEAAATDAGAGLSDDGLTATLDGEPVELPYATSSTELEPGEHELVVAASDTVGNSSEVAVGFTTADEQPTTELGGPDDGAEVTGSSVDLTATADSAEDDLLTMRFREGHTFTPTDAEVSAYAGTTHDATGTDRGEKVLLTQAQLEAVAGTDGITHEVTSEDALPYQMFTVTVPADAGADARARVQWSGSADADAKVLLYVRSTDGSWQEVDRHLTSEATDFTLEATVPVAGHAVDGEITVLVQHSEGFAGERRSTRESQVTAYNPGATPRSDYDFTIGWESDTQYYNETDAYYPHQQAIHRFLLDQRDELDLQYLIHTGDIVNVHDDPHQWDNADAAYDLLDEAGLPYGVLAGNHDVGHAAVDYTSYGQHFGKARYEDNPWYGGQLQNNRGHYDLVSAGGIDFLMLYMGWGPGDEQIDWMNEVISRYPERKVWVNLHEFMLTTGGLGPIPQRILDEVVAPNPNVFAVSSGHYHDAQLRKFPFDDDGDGVEDRVVQGMLFDYQGLPEGGLGYLRLMHFDNVGKRIIVRTYSPSLDDFDSDDTSLTTPEGQQEFEIGYDEVGIEPAAKTLATDSFRADILTSRDIAVRTQVPSGESRTVTWRGLTPGEHGWYVEVTGPHGGRVDSEVRTVVVRGVDAPEAGTPSVTGRPVVGGTVVAQPGRWPAGTRLTYQWLLDGRPLRGATGRTLRVLPAYAGHKLSVRVTGSVPGSGSAVATSAAVVVAKGTLRGTRPKPTGKARVGRVLVAHAGRWSPRPVTVRYRWYAGGKAVRGADGRRLRLTPKLRGKRVRVKVTVTKAGYQPVTRASRAVRVTRR